ncbi:MAG: hypothetical protein K0S65_6267, partial [Labilithrix sp.]|nr:hypothetical protein [Labilithrix sp.]
MAVGFRETVGSGDPHDLANFREIATPWIDNSSTGALVAPR